MVVDIEKVVVRDRIRKDFGNIQELADDIRQNGLINPPVVNKDYELLAGERRLMACKSLGWSQIEVRMMDTRDAEHELNVEISENDVRKGFTKSERVDYMKRLLRIEQVKANERERSGVKNPSPNSDEGRSDEKTARQFGIGKDTLRKEISIVENKDLLDPSDFADWDEGKLSTNKAFLKVKNRQKELEEENRKLREAVSLTGSENAVLKKKLEDAPVKEVVKEVTVEVVPDDYEDLKKKAKSADAWKKDYERQQIKTGEKQQQILELQQKIKDLQEQTVREQSNNDMVASAIMFATQCKNFIESVGGYVFLSERLMELPERERKGYQMSAQAVHDWAQVVLNNIERSNYELLASSGESN